MSNIYLKRYEEERKKILGVVLSCGSHSFNRRNNYGDTNKKGVLCKYPTICYSIIQLLNLDCDNIAVIVEDDSYDFYNNIVNKSDIFPKEIINKIRILKRVNINNFETRLMNPDIYYLFDNISIDNLDNCFEYKIDNIIVVRENFIPIGQIMIIEDIIRKFYKETETDNHVFGTIFCECDTYNKLLNRYGIDFLTRDVYVECHKEFAKYKSNNSDILRDSNTLDNIDIDEYIKLIMNKYTYTCISLDTGKAKYNIRFLDLNNNFNYCEDRLVLDEYVYGNNDIIRLYDIYLKSNNITEDIDKQHKLMKETAKSIIADEKILYY